MPQVSFQSIEPETHLDDRELERLLGALEDRVKLQLKPLDDRQTEILQKLNRIEERYEHSNVELAVMKAKIDRFETDLNGTAIALRREMKDRRALWVAFAGALPGLIALFLVYFLRGG